MDETFHHDHILITEPGELIAELPWLLGFHPADSLVVVCLGIDGDPTAHLALRVNLPDPADYDDLVDHIVIPLLSRNVTSTILIVVGGSATGPDDQLPHQRLVALCEQRFTDLHVAIQHALWAASTNEGACWGCYHDSDCAGFVPHQAHVPDGVRVYPSREDIAATLAPADEDVLARRADLLDAQPLSATDARSQLALLDAALDRAIDGVLPESDHDIVLLAATLTDTRVRDACIWQPDPVRAEAAERIWTTLVRETPAPERAEPATLLAFAAYQRGDGVLTAIALDCAQQAEPQHRLSDLLRAVLTLAHPPERLRQAGQRAALLAREQMAATGEGTPS